MEPKEVFQPLARVGAEQAAGYCLAVAQGLHLVIVGRAQGVVPAKLGQRGVGFHGQSFSSSY
jgi:hypothetical protein